MSFDLSSTKQSDPYVLILAGGSGERFWPLSRKNRPKQLLSLVSEKTLLEETVDRLEGFIQKDHLFILTNQNQEDAIQKLFPQLNKNQIIAEPAKRDTAAAVALGVAYIAKKDPHAVMVMLPADHIIKDKKAFQNDLNLAVRTASITQSIVTIGIKPTWACPGFGYIELGESFNDEATQTVEPKLHKVNHFREKPAPELAQSYLEEQNYRWNAGMFVWTVPAILCEFSKQAPVFADFITQFKSAENSDKFVQIFFPELPKISIDYAVMEKAAHVVCLEASFDWDDAGTWTAVSQYFQKDVYGNAVNREITHSSSANEGAPTQSGTAFLEAHGNIVFIDKNSKKHVSLLGVNDLIIIETEDALLICHRQEAEKIKQLISMIPTELQ